MASHLFKYIPFSVAQLTSAIDSGALALPDIQRPFVWPQTKVRDLLDSMYRGFPVGQVMFWQTGAEPGVKQIGTDAKSVPVPYHLIVDGQQRLTSLYAVMTGKPIIREDFTESVIRVAFNPFTEQFAIPDATTARQVDWLTDITLLFKSFLPTVEGYVAKVRDSRDVTEDQRQHLFAVFDRVRDLTAYQFSVVELDAAADEEQVAEVFVRINSEGVVLNQADFILTLMSVFWEKGRHQLEDFSRDAKTPTLAGASPFNWYIHPQPAQMLRVSAVLAFRRAVLKHVYSAMRGRDVDTGKPDPARRDAQFATLAGAQDKVLDLTNWLQFFHVLERAGYRGTKMISSENAVLYTYALWLIGRVDCGVPIDRLREVMARWFFMATVTSRYSGSFESRVEADLALLKDATTADDFCRTVDKVVTETLTSDFWSITLPNELASSASKSPSLLSYIAALNILDADPLLSTGKVRAWLDPAITVKKGIERHHLFPKQYLRKHLGITDTKAINQIANMALVEWSDNIKISDQAPAAYWPGQVSDKQKSAGLTPERLAKQMHWHALPDGWQDLGYEDFLSQRRVLMASVVRDAFTLLTDQRYQPTYPQPSTQPDVAQWTLNQGSGTSIRDLIASGLISAGTVLISGRNDVDASAEVNEDGTITFDDEVYESPSGAGRAACGFTVNGWHFWMADTVDGPRRLTALRETLNTEQ
jgi:hypothetical protein